jgi:type IV secretory pathway VirB10-like protein
LDDTLLCTHEEDNMNTCARIVALVLVSCCSADAIAADKPAKRDDLDVTMQIIVDPNAKLPDEVVRRIPVPTSRTMAPAISARNSSEPAAEPAKKEKERDKAAREQGREAADSARERAHDAAQQREEARNSDAKERGKDKDRDKDRDRPQPPDRPSPQRPPRP